MPATLDIEKRFVPCYQDPRTEADFDAACYPVEVRPAERLPDGVTELKAMFMAVYARRNACVRGLASLPTGSPHRAARREEILRLTEAIDHLEDVCTPMGFIAEPATANEPRAPTDDPVAGFFVQRLTFTHAPVAAPEPPASYSSYSLYIPLSRDGFANPQDPS